MKARTFAAYLVQSLNQIKGKKAFQKLLYLAKAMGIPMNYSYEMYYYGPYSDAVAEEFEDAYFKNIIDKEKDNQYIYIPGKGLEKAMVNGQKEIQENQEILTDLLQKFGEMSPRELEIYSTAHFVWKIQGIFGWSTSRENVIKEVKKAKYLKFKMTDIEHTYEKLVEWELIKNH
ncbi:hypothetical protein M1N64_04040 [Peptococcaceae bacterium]|nr:hypothetical protein [Peptococcaceae bacterium]